MASKGAGRLVIGTLLAWAASAPLALAASHPDLSGTWALPFEVHSSGVPLVSGQTPWLPASQGDPKDYPILTLQQLSARVDQSVREHHGNPLFANQKRPQPPLTAQGRAAAAKINAAAVQQQELDCYPSNVFARVGGGFAPIEIVQGDKAVAIIADGYFPGRVVYTDGAAHDRLPPQWNGLSTGHWEGDSLRVETAKIRGEELQPGYPISEDAKLIEVLHLIHGGKTLEVDATFEDPAFYTEPLRKVMYLDAHPELQVTDYSCEEGKTDMIESAQASGGKH